MPLTTPKDELLTTAPILIDMIDAALESGDRRGVEHGARALKRRANAAGEVHFGHLCETLECAARDEDPVASAAARRCLPFAWSSLQTRLRL